MFEGTFKPKPRTRTDDGSCEIKIRKTQNGVSMKISPGCTKEQIEMAKLQLGNTKIEEEQ